MLAVVGLIVASLAIVGVAVFGGYDRSLLVPPPEAVAESFTQQIATRRYSLARNMLSTNVARTETTQTLETRFAPLFGATGEVNRVEAEPLWMHEERSAAKAIVLGNNGTVAFELGLVRERGLWKIDALPRLR